VFDRYLKKDTVMKKILVISAGLIGFLFIGRSFCLMTCNNQRTVTVNRSVAHGVDPIFVNRWSPRAMSGEGISNENLMTLFEAAGLAPSSYNAQPWRFIYAHRDTTHWQKLFNLLVPFNQEWVKNAGVLVLVVSKKTSDSGAYSPTHSFDAGAACENFALQGSLLGLVVHGMGGFDFERARIEFNIGDDYAVEAMFAVGKPGDVTVLPEYMQAMETPSSRNKVQEIAFEGFLG
jgi:nitroreductase